MDVEVEQSAKRQKVEPVKRGPRRKFWVFTWQFSKDGIGFTEDEPSDNWMEVTRYFSMNCTHVSMQEELGSKEGRYHIQGFAAFKKALRFSEIKELRAISWSQPSKASELSNVAYTTKSDTSVPGGIWWSKGFDQLEDIKPYSVLYPWQKEVWDMCKTKCRDNRSIYWYYDEAGNAGKTTLVKSMAHHLGAFYSEGKTSTTAYRITQMRKKPQVCLLNYRRTQEGYTNYNSIEGMKDGLLATDKYEGGACIWDSPHVIVFANFVPKLTAVTKERWIVRSLTGREYKTLTLAEIDAHNNKSSDPAYIF